LLLLGRNRELSYRPLQLVTVLQIQIFRIHKTMTRHYNNLGRLE